MKLVMRDSAHRYSIFDTAAGFCGIAWNDIGITRFVLPSAGADVTQKSLKRRLPAAEAGEPPPAVAAAIAAVKRYFEGERTDFAELQLDLGEQNAFFAQVYAAARRVGWGETTTYGTLARQLSQAAQAARDVGQAMANNPIPLIIPCHRVLAAGGKVGGFSAPGGSATKARMLELEGVRLSAPAQGSLEL